MEAPHFRDFFGNQSFLNKQGQGSFDQEAAERVPLGQDEEQQYAFNMQLLQNQQNQQLVYHHDLMQMRQLARQNEAPPIPYPYHYYGGNATMQDMETGGGLATGGIGSHNVVFSPVGSLNGLSVSQGFGSTFLPEQNQRLEWQGSSDQSLNTQMAHSYMTNNHTSAGSDSLLVDPPLEQPSYYRVAKMPSDLNESQKSFLGSHNAQYETARNRQNIEHSPWPIHSIRETHNPEKINFMSNNRQQLPNLMPEQQAYFPASVKDLGSLEVLKKFHDELSTPDKSMRMQSQNVIVHQPTPSVVPRGFAASEKRDFEYRSYKQGQLSRDSGQIVDRERSTPGPKDQRYWQSRNPGQSDQLSRTVAGMQDSSSSPIYSNNGKLGLANTIDPNWQKHQIEASNEGLPWGQQTCSDLRSPQRMHSEAMNRDGQQNLLANSAENETHGSAKKSYSRMLFDDLEDNEELNLQPEISVVDQQNVYELQPRDASTLPQTNPRPLMSTGSVMNASALDELDNNTVHHPSQESRLKRIWTESKESYLRELSALMAPSSMPHWQPRPTGDAFRQESRIDAGYGKPTSSFSDNAGEGSTRTFDSSVDNVRFALYDAAANSTPSGDNGVVKQAHSNEFLLAQLPAHEKGLPLQSPSNRFHSREGNEAKGVPEQAKASAISHPLGLLSPRNSGLQLALRRSPSPNPQQGFSPTWHSESVSKVRSEMSEMNRSQHGWSYERDISNDQSRMNREGVNASAYSFLVPDSQLQRKHPSIPVSYGWPQYPPMRFTGLYGGSRGRVRGREDSNFASLPQENSSVVTHSPSPILNHEQMVHPEGFRNVMQRSGMPALDLKGGSIESWSVPQRLQNVHALTSKEGEAYEGASRLGGERILNYPVQSICNKQGVSCPEESFKQGNTYRLDSNGLPRNFNSVMPMMSSGSQGISNLTYQADDAKVSKQNDGYFRELNDFRRPGNSPSVVTTVSTTSNNFETLSLAQNHPLPFQGTTPLPNLGNIDKLSNGGVPLSSLSLRQQAQRSEQAGLKDFSTKQDPCFDIRSGEAFEDQSRPQSESQLDPVSLLRLNEKPFKQSLDSHISSEEGLSKPATEYGQIRPPPGNLSSEMNIARFPQYQSASKSPLSDTGRTAYMGNTHEQIIMAQATVNRYNESVQQSHLVEIPLQYPCKISQRPRGSEEYAAVASASNNTLAPESHLLKENQKLSTLSQKKRKRTSSLAIPWHLAIKQLLDHLVPPRDSELTWAASTNHLPEKDIVEVERHTSTHSGSKAMTRLKLTTEMMQRIVPLLPISLMHGIPGRDYESIVYTLNKVSLEETCRLVSGAQVHTRDYQRKQIHTASMNLESHFELGGHGVLKHSLTSLLKRFTEDVDRLESELVRLENSSSALELVKELQDVDKVGIVNRLSKHHGGRSFLPASMDHCNINSPEHFAVVSGRRQFTQRYVTAWPMPRIIPEAASYFSL